MDREIKSTTLRTWISQLAKRPGVYMIRLLDNGAAYVGSATKSIQQRLQQNLIELDAGTHDVPLLQEDWNEFGSNRFVWSICYAANGKQARLQEIELIKLAHALEDFGGYNRRTDINCIGASLRDTERKLSKTYRKERYFLLPTTKPHQRIDPGILRTFCQQHLPLAKLKSLALPIAELERQQRLAAWNASALCHQQDCSLV